jgi:signal transduction histidine kinase
MQAHPQSTPAARIPTTSLGTSRPATLVAPPSTGPRVRFLPPPVASGVAESAGLAHDAGNLLAALTLYCDLLRAPGVLREEHLHYATELHLIASRSSALIQRLLHSAPYPPRTLPADRADFQPAEVRRRDSLPPDTTRPGLSFTNTLRNLAPVMERIAAGAAAVKVTAFLPPTNLFPADLTPETLERITVNLVRNAAEAIRTQRLDLLANALTPAQPGEIRVTLALVAGRLQLSVEDNGPGIPPGIAAAFLQPTPLPPGTLRGLGHRIVHELVSTSGGQISIRVRPGKGTVFCIKWPLSHTRTLPADPFNNSADSKEIVMQTQKGAHQC